MGVAQVLLSIQMHWGYHPAILFRLPQVGINEVHPVIFQLALVHQVVLDGTGSVLPQLTQQYITGAPELDQPVTQLRGAFIAAQVFPLGRRLLFQAGAVDAFQQWRFFLLGYDQQRSPGRNLIATALQYLVVVVLIFTFQSLGSEQGAVTAGSRRAFDFKTQGRALFECLGQGVQRALSVFVQLAGAWGERHIAQVFRASARHQPTDELERRRRCAHHQVTQGLPDNRHHTELRVVQVAGDRKFDGDLAVGVLEQGNGQANRQIHGVGAVDFLTQLQLLNHHFVFSLQLAFGDHIMQVQVKPALADAETGEPAGVRRQRGQLDAFEAGGDIQRRHRIKRVHAAFDGHWRIAIHLALDVDAGRFGLAAVNGADLPVELLNGRGKVGREAEVGKVGRAVIDRDLPYMDAQWLIFAGRWLGCRFSATVGRLRDQQVIDVGGAVIIDHEARVRLQQVDLVDRQAVAVLIIDTFEHQALPFEEVAGLERVQGVQLVDLSAAGDLKRQGLGALEVYIQVAAQHTAAQFQPNERADIGLSNPQVDVLGIHFEFGADRVEIDLAGCLNLALFTQAGVDLQGKRALVQAVEVLHIDVQGPQFQRYRRFGLTVGQVHLIVTQLHILEQYLPGLARCGRFSLWRVGRRRRSGGLGRLGRFARLAGEQFLPVQLPIGFAGGPGFQLVAANLADHHVLLGQVHRGVTDVQAFQAHQWAAIGRLDSKRRNAGGRVGQVQFGFFGEAECVVGAEIQHTVFQHKRHGVTDRRPPGFHLAVGDFQRALGRDRYQAEVAFPVDLPTLGTGGHQRHVGVVVRQGAEVFQFKVEFVVEEFDRFAGTQVLKMHIAARQLDTVDAQRERLGVRVGRGRFARRQLEQLRQVQLAGFVEQQLSLGLIELHIGQVQGTSPQAVDLQVGVETLETHLLLARFTDFQAPS